MYSIIKICVKDVSKEFIKEEITIYKKVYKYKCI